ncbi:hypothetical protein ZOSMA_265G00200 [Zostera marina]|uniref:Uncharacterized protein n=2 Tax=Zostera marina TaxID=29655 RepID=A0A0K9PEX2_ZOSMR|nr:hypothetical protein ZOSMA_265G00200 [Zostera marina]
MRRWKRFRENLITAGQPLVIDVSMKG